MAQNGTHNTGLEGQCTWGANQWYHDATGYWVPWGANAKDYANQARVYGWSVSSSPVVPSIICFQPGVQGANSTYGHVAFAHTLIGKNGVVDRNLNYGPNPSVPTDLTHYSGTGVSFIYATAPNGKPVASSGARLSSSLPGLGPGSDVTDLLGLIDVIFEIRNPFDMGGQKPAFQAWGFSIPDPVGWAEEVGGNFVEDMAALTLRFIVLIVAIFILFKVSSNWIDYGAIAKSAGQMAMMAGV